MDDLVYGGSMLFHDYVEILLGSKVKIKVLRTLWKHRGKEFTIRELAGYLQISHMGVRKALSDLEKMNVISIRAVGKSHAVRLNTESYLTTLIESVFIFEDETLEGLVELINKKLTVPEVASAALFGSIARREETPLSDIDILIVSNQREKVEETISELQREVALKFGNALSPYYLTEDDLKEGKATHLIQQILQDHLLVCGKPLVSG